MAGGGSLPRGSLVSPAQGGGGRRGHGARWRRGGPHSGAFWVESPLCWLLCPEESWNQVPASSGRGWTPLGDGQPCGRLVGVTEPCLGAPSTAPRSPAPPPPPAARFSPAGRLSAPGRGGPLSGGTSLLCTVSPPSGLSTSHFHASLPVSRAFVRSGGLSWVGRVGSRLSPPGDALSHLSSLLLPPTRSLGTGLEGGVGAACPQVCLPRWCGGAPGGALLAPGLHGKGSVHSFPSRVWPQLSLGHRGRRYGGYRKHLLPLAPRPNGQERRWLPHGESPSTI